MQWHEAHSELTRLLETIKDNDAMTEEEVRDCIDMIYEDAPDSDDGLAREPKPQKVRRGNDDALSNRPPEPGTAEYDYMHRYDSPDNRRDTMG